MIKQVRNIMRTIAVASAFAITLGTGLVYANIDVGSRQGTTGPFSENIGLFEIDKNLDIEIDDSRDLNNDINVDVDAGNTDVNSNTEVGDLETGDVNADIVFSSMPEEDDGDLGDIDEVGDVTADFVNRITGPNSENVNRVDVNQDINLDIENDSEINNDLNFDVTTGGNDVTNNTIVGDVTTGDIDLTADIESSNGGCLSTCPSIGSLSGLGGGDIEADFANGITGPNSLNENTLDVENNVEVEVENNSRIDNNFDINADSGENEVSNNTIVGDIETGSIDVNISATNMSR